jgi:hypothetical protein
MKKMLSKSVLDKLGTLLLALAIWYVVRQRTELHQAGRSVPSQQPAASGNAR